MATFPPVLFIFLKGVAVLTSGFPYQVWVYFSTFFSLFMLFISCTCSRKILGTCGGADVLSPMPLCSYIIANDQKSGIVQMLADGMRILPSCPSKQNLLY